MKTIEISELRDRINELLHIIEEGQFAEITDHGKVISRVVPPIEEAEQPDEPDDTAIWEDLKRLSAELSAHAPAHVDAVDVIREMRRDF